MSPPPFQASLDADLRRRALLFRAAIQRWKSLSETGQADMGIHRSQVAAIDKLLDDLADRLDTKLAALDVTTTPTKFTATYDELDKELVGLYSLLATFRVAFDQRFSQLGTPDILRVLDLIAAYCYLRWRNKAEAWGILAPDHLREPPLTFFNAERSPAAYTRERGFGVFGVRAEFFATKKLPINLISLPFHHAASSWTYCTLYHEVGHTLDLDFGLQTGLAQPLLDGLSGVTVPAARSGQWRAWLREIIADTVGVLMGGDAFADALSQMLYLPPDLVKTIATDDRHPTPYVRIFLLGALLRRAGLPEHIQTAKRLEDQWKALYKPAADVKAYLADVPVVVQTMVDTALTALQGHSLWDFVKDTLAKDRQRSQVLADYLASGLMTPVATQEDYRLMPAAAQLALRDIDTSQPSELSDLQARVLDYTLAIKPPEFLAAATPPSREAYWKELVTDLTWD